jgi:hypothetical protein
MDEVTWLTSIDPRLMLLSLRGQASERKLRLAACAFCRLLHDLLVDEGLAALDAAEKYADGLIDLAALNAARNAARSPDMTPKGYHLYLRDAATQGALQAAVRLAWGKTDPWGAATQVLDQVLETRWRGSWKQAPLKLAEALREVVGNPFHPITVEPSWLTPTVRALAQVIYEAGRFEDLPVLADALEDSGCTDPQILEHCRGMGPHVRGCWVVDLLTGRS